MMVLTSQVTKKTFSSGFARQLPGVKLVLPSTPPAPALRSRLLLFGPDVSRGIRLTSTDWIVRSEGRDTAFQWRFLSGRWARIEERMFAQSGEVRKAGGAEYVTRTSWEAIVKGVGQGNG
jgi:hypothetical protein